MDVTASLDADAVEPRALFDLVSDLGTYPRWLDIVGRAVPAEGDDGDPGPAWSVDLRGQLGPLRRSKRLRMVRARSEADRLVVFERRDLDGRDHSDWVMRASIMSTGGGSTLEMNLHYGGSLWVPLLDRLLADEIQRSRTRLLALLGAT